VARITVSVSPRARRNEIVGRHGEGWKIRIAAPPERGRANRALIQVLAEALGIARAGIVIEAGHGSRQKIVEIAELEAPEVERRLDAARSELR
jgi:uncharacterized protein (TIGR00251 family)